MLALSISPFNLSCPCLLVLPLPQAIITAAEDTTAVSQLQATLSAAHPGTIPPPLAPLVVVAPFGSGKRALLQALAARLPEVVRVPQLVTTKPRQPYDKPGGWKEWVGVGVVEWMWGWGWGGNEQVGESGGCNE